MYDGKVRDAGIKYQELQDKSGTEPHSLAYIPSTKRERKAKKARAAAIVVSAAAQRQALHIRAAPCWRF